MTLLTDLPKLREMEQKEPRWVDERGCAAAVDVEYLNALYQNAPATLAVLECFREGDAASFQALIGWLDAMQKSSDFVISPMFMQMLVRHQKAAATMGDKGDV